MADRPSAGITVEVLKGKDGTLAVLCSMHGLDCTEERAIEIAQWMGATLDMHCHEIGLTQIGETAIKRYLDS